MRLMTFRDVFPDTPGPLSPSDPIFMELATMKVTEIFKYQVSKFIFKCLNQLTPVQFHNWFTLNCNRHGHKTRSNFDVDNSTTINNLFIPVGRTTNYGLKQLKVNGPRIWNELPIFLKNETSLHVFLRKIKLYYISGYS